MDIQTIQGKPASILGLARQDSMEAGCVELAWQAGVNYFFSYGMGNSPLLKDLQQLLEPHRESVIVATGSEQREVSQWRDYIEQVRQTLAIDTVDILFAEYVSPVDDWEQVKALLNQLYTWKAAGLVRYVGVTTHNRAIADPDHRLSFVSSLYNRPIAQGVSHAGQTAEHRTNSR